MRSPTVRWTVGIIAAIVVLVLLRFKPWVPQRPGLTVAYIPVTYHLTCPVTDFASKTSTTGTRFDALRFTEFPPIVEAVKTKRILAAFVTVPLAMKMREQGTPIKICCLGHRDGSQLTIRKENPAKDLRDMKGKTIAIP